MALPQWTYLLQLRNQRPARRFSNAMMGDTLEPTYALLHTAMCWRRLDVNLILGQHQQRM